MKTISYVYDGQDELIHVLGAMNDETHRGILYTHTLCGAYGCINDPMLYVLSDTRVPTCVECYVVPTWYRMAKLLGESKISEPPDRGHFGIPFLRIV